MSSDVDSTMEAEPSSSCTASGRSGSGSSSPISTGENHGGGGNMRDSGVEIPTPSSRSMNGQEQGPTTELRRLSMLTADVKLEDFARDWELMYFLHNRRGSFPSDEAGGSRVQTSLSNASMPQLSPAATELNCSACCRQWNPRFHSQVLERYWKVKATEFLRRRYRVAVLFIALFALLWVVFFSVSLPFNGINGDVTSDQLALDSVRYSDRYIIGGSVVFVFAIALLLLTFWRHYGKIATLLSITLALVLMTASVLIAIGLSHNARTDMDMTNISTISFVTQFTISAIVVLVVYTLSRFPIWLAASLCFVYMVILELASSAPLIASESYSIRGDKLFIHSFVARFIFHICLNVVGLTTGYLSQVRLHDTFWRIAQCVLSRKMIESERDVEEKTIHSMMPKQFAEELLSTEVQVAFMLNQPVCLGRESIPPALRSVSAPFTVRRMNEVSILFADIVDFTLFSSRLSAVDVVGILDDIFSTFDYLTQKHRCEKINTLGDCYFCVSGCPTEDDNHANNCVDMGLSIINSLSEYRTATNHPIEMRVGIHTGSVLCGVMGTKRFKFDVWSRDVTIASHIESVGIPGKVIISSATLTHLSTALYNTEEADLPLPPELNGLQLYKVTRRRDAPGPVPSWRLRIKSIDSLIREERSSQPPQSRPCCAQTLQNKQLSNTLRDSLTRQSYLQRCASYTELADPNMGHQVIIDKRIVELMEEQQVSLDSYYDTEINYLTLSFDHRSLEQCYRNYGRGAEESGALKTELGYQLAKRSYLIDTISLFSIFILIMTATVINLSGGKAFIKGKLWQSWLVILIIGLLVEGTIVLLVLAVYFPNLFPRRFSTIAHFSINWYVRTVVSLILIYSPMAMVTITMTQCHIAEIQEDFQHVQMAFYITIVVLICSISFMEVSYIVKLVGGILSAVVTLLLVSLVHLTVCDIALRNDTLVIPTATAPPSRQNATFKLDSYSEILVNYYNRHIAPEAAILFLLVITLLLIVNRMSELSVRLSFIGRMQAALRKQFARQQKNRVEWLLFNIIPPHVALELRNNSSYSRVHERVGVIFASIVNFSDFSCRQSDSDEQAFRLLNKIVREFDSLLDQPQFASVEKIKTIGSTYMAASGLSLTPDQPCSVEHLIALIDFSLQLGDVLRRVSILVPGFSFLLRVGFNYGPVTSGVVGSNKLLFDIWGDTVNVASRMDSTGQVFKIHMPKDCLELLGPYVTCDEVSRVVEIKGKGNMRTVFVNSRKNTTISSATSAGHNSQ